MIDIYKDVEFNNISSIVDKYVESYQKSITYKKSLIKLMVSLRESPKYDIKYREWRTFLTKKDPDLVEIL